MYFSAVPWRWSVSCTTARFGRPACGLLSADAGFKTWRRQERAQRMSRGGSAPTLGAVAPRRPRHDGVLVWRQDLVGNRLRVLQRQAFAYTAERAHSPGYKVVVVRAVVLDFKVVVVHAAALNLEIHVVRPLRECSTARTQAGPRTAESCQSIARLSPHVRCRAGQASPRTMVLSVLHLLTPTLQARRVGRWLPCTQNQPTKLEACALTAAAPVPLC